MSPTAFEKAIIIKRKNRNASRDLPLRKYFVIKLNTFVKTTSEIAVISKNIFSIEIERRYTKTCIKNNRY